MRIRLEITAMKCARSLWKSVLSVLLPSIPLSFLPLANLAVRGDAVDPRVLQAQAKRVAVIEKVSPAVVAIFAHGGQGGGSGVLISKDGYALTNFHVVQGSGPFMQCGLPDGVLYDAVLVGLDKVGDVALIKLLPQKEGQEFPAAILGDSAKVKAGDWSLALGNPFLLATDFTPTVTYGLVSGVHRYQYPEASRGLLEYTDCIQTDTSINPGNSGGPLFNMDGELIGINGRISLEKRGRVNSGVGYAISINQIKNFLGHLRAGLDTDHASLGAIVKNREEDGVQSGMVVTRILADCDAHRRGLDLDDEVVSFAGRPVSSQNHYKNVLGLFPKGWRLPLVYRRDNAKHEILVRLMGVQRQELGEDGRPRPQQPLPPRPPRLPDRPPDRRAPAPPEPEQAKDSPAAKLYESKPGFANFYFNKLERDRLWTDFRKQGDFTDSAGGWTIEGEFEINQKKSPAKIVLSEEKSVDGKSTKAVVRLTLGGVGFQVDPLKTGQDPQDLTEPPGSGGLLMALYHYRRLLTLGEKGFEGQFVHGGQEPFYPPPADDAIPQSLSQLRKDTEVLLTEHAAIPAKWYFALADKMLLGGEITVIKDEDPCEVYFSAYRPVHGKALPHRVEVRYGNGKFGVLWITSYQFTAAK
jgi:S1-C subfamily serine protease